MESRERFGKEAAQSKIKDEGRWRERNREDEQRGDLVTVALLDGFVTHTKLGGGCKGNQRPLTDSNPGGPIAGGASNQMKLSIREEPGETKGGNGPKGCGFRVPRPDAALRLSCTAHLVTKLDRV